jgi:hypothetical protein
VPSIAAGGGAERYQSIDDTIVQLFISRASVLMSRVDRTQNPSRPGMGEETAFCAASGLITFLGRFVFTHYAP